MHGSFVWNELATHDVSAAMRFYAHVLGWRFEEFALPEGAYWVARCGDRLVGGLGGMETGALAESTTPYWFAFIEVDDVDARVATAKAAGAAIIRAPHEVPNVGRVAVLRDPTGAAIGWMTGLKPPT